MVVAMVALSRTQTGSWASRKVIPADVRDEYGKREEKKSWPATLTREQAKAEWAAWLASVENHIRLLRAAKSANPISLTQRECMVLAGEWYRAKVEAEESLFTDSNAVWDWDADLDSILPNDDGLRGESAPLHSIPSIVQARDALLQRRGLKVDAASAERLLQAMLGLYVEFLRLMQRRVAGDFGADPVLATLPQPEVRPSSQPRSKATLSLSSMFEDYAATGSAAPHTVTKWRSAFRSLVEHLGHDDALAVTRADVSGWLQALVSRGLAVKTVRATYRAAVSRVFALAHGQGRLAENPAAGLEVIGPKARHVRRKDISDAEARVILAAALGPQREELSTRHALARRWVPWICAYTGARVGEITQLRAGDIREQDGVWVFHITPEAGSVKTGRARSVPIHSDLIEQGILKLARPRDTTPLFYDPEAARNPDAAQPQPKQLASKLAKWVRGLGVNEVQSPNHGWRHRWKSQARLHRVDPEARDVIPGHAPGREGGNYGDGGYPVAALKEEIEKLPRYDLAGQ